MTAVDFLRSQVLNVIIIANIFYSTFSCVTKCDMHVASCVVCETVISANRGPTGSSSRIQLENIYMHLFKNVVNVI